MGLFRFAGRSDIKRPALRTRGRAAAPFQDLQSVIMYLALAMIRAAKGLSPDQKTAIESLLGRRVLEDEEISVRAICPPALSEQRRKELIEELKKYFAEADARRQPGSAEQADEILDEAMRSVRPGYRPHQ